MLTSERGATADVFTLLTSEWCVQEGGCTCRGGGGVMTSRRGGGVVINLQERRGCGHNLQVRRRCGHDLMVPPGEEVWS